MGGKQNRRTVGADPAGCTDAHGGYLVPCGQFRDHLGDHVLGLAHVVSRGEPSGRVDDLAFVVDHSGGNLGPADVDSDR